MQNWDSNTKNPIIPNFALCSLDLSYIWVQNLVTQINLTENQIFCEVEDLQRVPLESVESNSHSPARTSTVCHLQVRV